MQVAADLPAPDKAAVLAEGGVTVYLPLAGLVDLVAERKRIQGEIDNVDRQLQRIAGLLDNPGFTSKAPPEVIDRERAKASGATSAPHAIGRPPDRIGVVSGVPTTRGVVPHLVP